MKFLAPFFKASFISSVIFFVLVFLGMRYHWVGSLKNKAHNEIELNLPQQTQDEAPSVDYSDDVDMVELDEPDAFQPEIINTPKATSVLASMSKEQITERCLQLSKKAETDKTLLELVVGDCVISNFKESIQEDAAQKETRNTDDVTLTSSNNQQVQLQKTKAENSCRESVEQVAYQDEVEKQLLLGVCVSDLLSRDN